MYRYAILIWSAANPDAALVAKRIARRLQASSPEWARVVDEPGLAAFHAGAGGVDATSRDQVTSCETRVLTGRRRGAVFGRAFRVGQELVPHPQSEPVDASESERVCASEGRHLIDSYWGRYVAVFRDERNVDVCLLRDPTGGLPCFVIEHEGVHLVFSEMASVLTLGLPQFTINWKYVASFVPYSGLQIRQTGLNEVTELQPGERAAFRGAKIEHTLLWKPSEIAAKNRIVDAGQATAAVREVVRHCVHAWASLHHSIVHNLSGGLDSSIVLGCLKSAPNNPRVTCIHYYSPTSNEDEREYARLVARHMDTPLVECEIDPAGAPLERLLEIRPAPKPWFYIYDLVHSPLEARVVADHGATATFSGAGGDGLFLQSRAELAVADYLRHFGYRSGVFRVAHDAARINRASIWSTLRQGLRRHWKRPSKNVLSEFADARAVIPADVMQAAWKDDSLLHVWIREAEGLTPGLLWQILCLSVPAPFYESFGGPTELERMPVLMSQPLMELCLRIPSYVWITGGRDRAIARRAFADVLPRAVVRRTQKGHIDRYNRKMLDDNPAMLREMLIDGLLVKAGLLDRQTLIRYMDPSEPSTSFEYNEVLRQHLCTEIWARQWAALTTSSAP